MTKRIGILYFSSTSTTKKICKTIALGMGEDNPQTIGITLPDIRTQIMTNLNIVTANIDHLIVGTPVHSVRLPLQAKDCLTAVEGKGSPGAKRAYYYRCLKNFNRNTHNG